MSDVNEKSKGARFNKGKPRLGLIAPEGTIQEGRGMTLGEMKYGTHNWRKGITILEYCDSALRHIHKFLDGQDIDPESEEYGYPVHHLGLAKCNLGMALQTLRDLPDMDDRFKGVDLSGEWQESSPGSGLLVRYKKE